MSIPFAFIALSSAFNSLNRWQESDWVIRARETTRGLPNGVSKVRFPFAFVFTVTNTNDIGLGSLRQAILDSNANPGPPGTTNLIEFNISGSGVHTIMPATQLPDIVEPVMIDGYTQPGSHVNTLAQLGLGSQLPVDVRGTPVAPREFLLALLKRQKLLGVPPGLVVDDWEVTDLEIVGRRGTEPVTRHALARFPPWPKWGLSATEYAVGVCGAIGAELIASGAVAPVGVIPPERCIPAAPFRAALAERGIATTIVPLEPPLPPTPRGAKAE